MKEKKVYLFQAPSKKQGIIRATFLGIFIFIIVGVTVLFGVLYGVNPSKSTEERDYIGESTEFPAPATIHLYMAMDKKYKEKLGYKGARINELYAKKWGFKFHLFDNLDESKLQCKSGLIKDFHHPQGGGFRNSRMYLKIVGGLELMKTTPINDILIYIDGDAWAVEHDRDIRQWIPKNPDTYFLIGNEMNTFSSLFPKVRMTMDHGVSFNAGFFLYRNNEWVKKFFERILYNACIPRPWHDQGNIGDLYKNNKDDEQIHIKVIPMEFAIQHHLILGTENPQIKTPMFVQSHETRHPTALLWHSVNLGGGTDAENFFLYEGNLGEMNNIQIVNPTQKPIVRKYLQKYSTLGAP